MQTDTLHLSGSRADYPSALFICILLRYHDHYHMTQMLVTKLTDLQITCG
jgi:hypothetical protein